nr:e3 ubiquitin-protein ligase tom1-like [Quercus suber]
MLPMNPSLKVGLVIYVNSILWCNCSNTTVEDDDEDEGMGFVPMFRSHRSASAALAEDDGTNPLLQRFGVNAPGTDGTRRDRETVFSRLSRRAFGMHRGDGGTFIQDLVAAVGPGGPGTINVTLGSPGARFDGVPPVFTVTNQANGRGWPMDTGRLRDLDLEWFGQSHSGGRNGGDEAQAVHFTQTPTVVRWQEEARMLFGGKHHEKATRIINTLYRLLVPTAMEARKQRDKEEMQRRLAEEQRKEEIRKQTEALKAEREAEEKREREEREAREAEQVRGAAAGSAEDSNDMQGVEHSTGHGEADVRPSAVAQAESEGPVERITTTIRGREIDISSMGIDAGFLEALPEEMREEVIMQQVVQQRAQAPQTGETPSEISPEFLEALPPDIQDELLRQEASERRHRAREEERLRASQAGNVNGMPQAEELNNADFIAMLEPGLRQQVLMETDEGTLAALPEELQAEARALIGDRVPRQGGHMMPRRPGLDITAHAVEVAGNRAAAAAREASRQRRPVAQMLDKPGVATLLRLMFVSLHHKAKNNLHGILSDVCKNTQNRAEVISILLSILQDGTTDLGAVDRSFAQLSLRAKQTSVMKTPQSLKRSLTGQAGQTFNPSTDLSPLNIVQQCLATMNALAVDNPKIPSFFLTEHETIVGQKPKSTRKAKGRESRANRYPLNALLTLLDRKLITDNTAVMETLASLLSRVTQPLIILLRRQKEDNVDKNTEAGRQGERTFGESDVPMAESSTGFTAHEGATGQTSTSELKLTGAEDADKIDKKKHRDLTPPEVPDENIGLVVNILAARECQSKTFSDTLDIIKHLSAIPGAREVFGRELVRQAQELAQTVQGDLEQLASQMNSMVSGTDLQGIALASFSTADTKQRKLLRVLLALDHLYKSQQPVSNRSPQLPLDPKLKDDVISVLYESSTFEKLWKHLSLCLEAIRRKGNMTNVAAILLPLIEALMVVCRNTTLKDVSQSTAISSSLEVTVGTPPPESRMEGIFFQFTEDNRKILNELIRTNPKLMSGHLALLAKNSKMLEFDNKRTYFARKLHNKGEVRHPHQSIALNVRRDVVFKDSFKGLYYRSGDEIKYGKLNIRFSGEEGVDAGGVSREWFAAMARQMFNADYALFNPVASDRTTFHPNTLSFVNESHLLFFRFIGRIIGKALYEGRVLDCYFSRAVYRRMLGKSVSLKDMESLDLDYYKSLVWILENDITDITFETFSVEFDRFGVTETVDLIENGRNIPVTEENKQEYVRLVVEWRLIKSVAEQLQHFLVGFHEIIPPELIAIFNEQELELLISGLPEIDVDDWKNNTEYHNYQATSPQIQWFWRAVRSFDKEEKAKLLQFVTGTSKVPLNGFKELEGMNGFARFNIHRDFSSKEKLPSSHTCFNQLDLPEYESYEHLRHQLYTAITAGSEYFGFA